MSLRISGSTSGYTELDAGAVAGNNTIKMPTANGSAYQVLRNGATAGTTEFADNIVSGTAQASTSGTSIDFTGIPSWVKRVTVMMRGVSTNGTSLMQLQIGAGSVETTGYTGAAAFLNNSGAVGTEAATRTSGIPVMSTEVAADVWDALITVTHMGSNVWIFGGVTTRTSAPASGTCGGSKTLSGTLDRVRITTVNGTDAFDAGTVNILME